MIDQSSITKKSIVQKELNQISKDQRGAIFPILALTIVVLVGIIGYSIDTSRSVYTVSTIQDAVDNSALSASRQLNGEPEGWDNAKSVAVVNLQKNKINSVSQAQLDSLVFNQDGPLGKNTIAQVGNFRVTVARGVYWSDQGSKEFVSLEEDVEDRGNGPWLHSDYNKHIFANAIRVEATVLELEGSAFSQAAFKNKSIKNLTRSAMSVSDSSIEFSGTPFAVPYCQFLLNNDSNEKNNHTLSEFDTNKSISRELIFTELDGFVTGSNDRDLGSADDERREGYRRYAWQVYNPTFQVRNSDNLCVNASSGEGMSCKNIPIRGLIGVYGDNPGTSTVSDVKNFLEAGGTQKVAIGQHFKPLGSWSDNTLLMDEVTNAMQGFLDQGNNTIDSEFIYEQAGRKFAKPSFPAVRHEQHDSGLNDFMKRPATYAGFGADLRTSNRITWPINIGGDTYSFAMLLGLFRQPGEQTPVGVATKAPFINTMCNNAVENLDRTDYKVRTQSVVIIAPSSNLATYEDGNSVSYCDFENQFQGNVQKSKVPWEKNEPRVVGRTTINFVGFNFKKLPNAPEYIDAAGTRIADFRMNPDPNFDNPKVLEINGIYRPEIRQFEDEYNQCADSVDNGDPDIEECDLGNVGLGFFVPEELRACFDDTPLVATLNQITQTSNQCKGKKEATNQTQNSLDECEEQLENAREQKQACYDMDRNDPDYQPCLDQGQIAVENAQQCKREQTAENVRSTTDLENCLENLSHDFGEFAFKSVANQIYTLQPVPNTFCLPLPKEQAFNFNAAESYESPIRPLRSGRGCGGVRARVAETSGNALLTSGKPWSEMRPALVN